MQRRPYTTPNMVRRYHSEFEAPVHRQPHNVPSKFTFVLMLICTIAVLAAAAVGFYYAFSYDLNKSNAEIVNKYKAQNEKTQNSDDPNKLHKTEENLTVTVISLWTIKCEWDLKWNHALLPEIAALTSQSQKSISIRNTKEESSKEKSGLLCTEKYEKRTS